MNSPDVSNPVDEALKAALVFAEAKNKVTLENSTNKPFPVESNQVGRNVFSLDSLGYNTAVELSMPSNVLSISKDTEERFVNSKKAEVADRNSSNFESGYSKEYLLNHVRNVGIQVEAHRKGAIANSNRGDFELAA